MPLCRPSVRARLKESLALMEESKADAMRDGSANESGIASGSGGGGGGEGNGGGGFRRTRDSHTLTRPSMGGEDAPSPAPVRCGSPPGDASRERPVLIRDVDVDVDGDACSDSDDEVPPLMTKM